MPLVKRNPKKKSSVPRTDLFSSSERPLLGLITIVFFALLVGVKLFYAGDTAIPGNASAAIDPAGPATPLYLNGEGITEVTLPTAAGKDELAGMRKISGQLKAGESLLHSLRRLAVPDEAQKNIIDSLRSCLDLRKLMPKNRITVFLDDEDQLRRCTYEVSPLEIYEIKRSEDSYSANRKLVEVEYRLESIDGVVGSSLFQAFSDLGEKPSLVYSFADIFASRIDFNTETQQNDTFTVVVKKYYKNDKFIGYGKIIYASYLQQENNRRLNGYLFEQKDGKSGYFDEDGEELGSFFIRSPVPIGRVTSRFSFHRKHPISGIVRPHLGVDLAAPIGTPIMAAADGKVLFAGIKGGFGKQIILQHGNGYRTHYGHLSRFARGLKVGSHVKQKDIIGYVGSTGVSTGPHLDYRLEENGIFKNPFAMNFKPRFILEGKLLAAFKDKVALLNGYRNQAENKIIEAKKITITENSPSIVL